MLSLPNILQQNDPTFVTSVAIFLIYFRKTNLKERASAFYKGYVVYKKIYNFV